MALSNHGGRRLDGTVQPTLVLPEATRAKGFMALMLGSCLRRGTDLIKAPASVADYVFVGRPIAYAAAVGGEASVTNGIAYNAMRYTGTWP